VALEGDYASYRRVKDMALGWTRRNTFVHNWLTARGVHACREPDCEWNRWIGCACVPEVGLSSLMAARSFRCSDRIAGQMLHRACIDQCLTMLGLRAPT